MLDLYQLKAFFVFGKVYNFTRAAEVLNITQSAVSHAIKKLEDSANVRLIEKQGRHFTLTKAGKELYKTCECVFFQLEDVQERIQNIQKQSGFQVKIGGSVEFGTTILIRHIKQFIDDNPHIHLDFHFSHHLKEPFINDEVDFIIDCKEHFFENTEKIKLFHEQYVTIACPEFIKKHHITCVTDLNRTTILSMDSSGEWWHNFLVSVGDVQFSDICVINHVRGLINGAIEGLGVAFVPRYTVINELEQGVLIDPFPDIRPLADIFCIYIKKEKLRSEKNGFIIDYLKSLKPSEFGEGAFLP